MMSAAKIETPDATQLVAPVAAPAVTPGSAKIEARLRDRLARLHDTWHALRRLQSEDKPGLKARQAVEKRIEYATEQLVEHLLGEPSKAVEVASVGPASASVASSAPVPVLGGESDAD